MTMLENFTRAVVKIDMQELCVRMLEAATGEIRDEALTAEQLLSTVDADILEQTMRCAQAAALYITQIAGAVQVIN